jgi:aryl-alcohol dehydrogenase-like predicted oxidoreductase
MEGIVSPLPRALLGASGPSVTRLGLGGEGLLRSFGRENEAAALIGAALDEGMTYLESARAYAGSESYYGGALGSRRDGIVLATKAHDRTANGARAMLDNSLRTLRTAALDLWQLHDVRTMDELDAMESPDSAYAAFVEAKERGDTRAIGVTGHFDPAVLRAAIERFAFDAVLLPINPAEGALDGGFERLVIPAARERGMAVIGMKVFARGLLLDANMSAGEAIRYALSADCDTIVVGCDDVAQLRENVQAARDFRPMPAAQRSELEARVAPRAAGLAYYRSGYAG